MGNYIRVITCMLNSRGRDTKVAIDSAHLAIAYISQH